MDEAAVVFLDIHMPYFRGYDFLDLIQPFDSRFKVHIAIICPSLSLADINKLSQYPRYRSTWKSHFLSLM